MLKKEATELYKSTFPKLTTYCDDKYGEGNWKAFRHLNGQFTVEPIEDIKSQYVDMLIAETDRNGFVWLKLTNEQAVLCIVSGLFEVYARFDDETETLVETLEEYTELSEVGVFFYLEVGHVDPDFFGIEL